MGSLFRKRITFEVLYSKHTHTYKSSQAKTARTLSNYSFPTMKLLLSTLSLLSASAYASDVLSPGDAKFDAVMAKINITIVNFFDPDCVHYRRMAVEFETAAEVLKNNNPSVPLIEVDCTGAGKATCQKYDISSYPTLKVFSKGNFYTKYPGGRKSSEIVRYIRSFLPKTTDIDVCLKKTPPAEPVIRYEKCENSCNNECGEFCDSKCKVPPKDAVPECPKKESTPVVQHYVSKDCESGKINCPDPKVGCQIYSKEKYGYYADPSDCRNFCMMSGHARIPGKFQQCAEGTVWNPACGNDEGNKQGCCDWPEDTDLRHCTIVNA